MLNVFRCQVTYYGHAETNSEAWFNMALRPRKPESSLGRTAQDGHLDSHTAPELCKIKHFNINYVRKINFRTNLKSYLDVHLFALTKTNVHVHMCPCHERSKSKVTRNKSPLRAQTESKHLSFSEIYTHPAFITLHRTSCC